MREVHWADNDRTGPTVLAITARLPDAECYGVGARTYVEPPVGPGAAFLALQAGRLSSRQGGWVGTQASVHAASIDNRPTFSGEVVGSNGRFRLDAGEVTLVIASNDVQPLAGYPSLAFDLACDQPFDVLGAMLGSEVLLANLESLHGGHGAGLAGEVTVTGIDSAAIDMTANETWSGYWSSPNAVEAVQVTLRHPGGVETLDGSQRSIVHDHAGLHSFEVTGANGRSGSELLFAFGFDGPLDLTAGLGEASAIA